MVAMVGCGWLWLVIVGLGLVMVGKKQKQGTSNTEAKGITNGNGYTARL
jgi:hypothetical protein